MNENLKHWMLQIFATKIGWLGLSLLSAIVFGILGNYYDWALLPAMLSWAWPIVFTLIAIVYAFIINPIRSYKENKAIKEKFKNEQ